jgi:hypothetical protein
MVMRGGSKEIQEIHFQQGKLNSKNILKVIVDPLVLAPDLELVIVFESIDALADKGIDIRQVPKAIILYEVTSAGIMYD